MSSEHRFLKQIGDKKLFVEPGFEEEVTISNVKMVLSLVREIEQRLSRSTAEKEGVRLTLVGHSISVHEPTPRVHYFKCDYKGRSFFLKHSLRPSLLGSGGHKEALGNARAQKILEDHAIGWAEVIKFKLGYTAKKELFFISEWKNIGACKTLKDYLDERNKLDTSEEEKRRCAETVAKFEALKKLFKEFFDFHPHNIWIDETDGKMYLFDLYLWDTLIKNK